MRNQPPLQSTPGVYNDGHGCVNPGGQSWRNPGGQSWGNLGGQNEALMNHSGMVLGGPAFCFSGSSRADSGYKPHPPRGRGRSPHPGNFGTNQSGNSPTGMNYSGAVTRQDTGAGAVTLQPQANTGRAGIDFMYCTRVHLCHSILSLRCK